MRIITQHRLGDTTIAQPSHRCDPLTTKEKINLGGALSVFTYFHTQ